MGGQSGKRRKLRRVTEDEALADLKPRPVPGEPYARTVRAAGRTQGVGVPWYRGCQAGQVDAIITLRELGHPRIAEKLRKHWGMNEDGNY